MTSQLPDLQLVRRDRRAVDLDLIGLRRRLDVVGEMDLGNDEAVLAGEFAPHLGDARGDLVARQDERGVEFLAEHELDLERLELLLDRSRAPRPCAARPWPPAAPPPRRGPSRCGAGMAKPTKAMRPPSIAKGRKGRPGTRPSTRHQQRRDEERVRIAGELVEHRLVGRAARAALGDQQARGERDDQRRDLRDEAVADRKLGEDVGGGGERSDRAASRR